MTEAASVGAYRIVDSLDGAALPLEWVAQAGQLIHDAVSRGAALGWVDPPPTSETTALLTQVAEQAQAGDASLLLAVSRTGTVVGFGYWRRYSRPTHRPHADLERIVVHHDQQGRGVGRALMTGLIASAREAGIEQLTLDARGDQTAALSLYRGLGFTEYGRLPEFVAVGDRRYDKTLWVMDLRG